MNYEHDIFISYRRDCTTTPWMKNVFLKELENHLKPGRHDGIDIFSDDKIRIGSTWETLLRTKIASSRIMLPMLTPYYFGSEWCQLELALMLEREEYLNIRSVTNSELGLVIPIRLWDGEKFPARINTVQLGDFREYTNVRKGTRKWGQFMGAIAALAAAIDQILDDVPDYDDAWLKFTGGSIRPQLVAPSLRQNSLIRLVDPSQS